MCSCVYDDYEIAADGYWINQNHFLLHIPMAKIEEQYNNTKEKKKVQPLAKQSEFILELKQHSGNTTT